MPAAAVIPAPIAYIKVVAVKKLVVGLETGGGVVCRKTSTGYLQSLFPGMSGVARPDQYPGVYFEEIRVFKAGLRLNTLAWNNEIGLWFYFVGLRTRVMIDRDSWGH